jgi:hypothetical protein
MNGSVIPATKEEFQLREITNRKNLIVQSTKWDDEVDNPTDWWITEHRSPRVMWDVEKREFFDEEGTFIPVPPSFKKRMPSIVMDGELWTNDPQDSFTNQVTLSKDSLDDEFWKRAMCIRDLQLCCAKFIFFDGS